MQKVLFFIIFLATVLFSSESDIQMITKKYKEKGVKLRFEGGETIFDAEDNHNIEDEDLAYLSSFENVTIIFLKNTKITDRGISYLLNIKEITFLSLTNTKITDSATCYISQLSNIEDLSLASTQVTNKSLENILKLQRLKRLNLYNTKVVLKGWPFVNPDSINLEFLYTPMTELRGNNKIIVNMLLWSTGKAPIDGQYIIGNAEKSSIIRLYEGESIID